MDTIKKQIEIRDEIHNLWKITFPELPEKERYVKISIDNLDEIVKFYIDRLEFCDNIKPTTDTKNVSFTDVIKIQCSDKIRDSILQDAKNTGFYNEISKAYIKKRKAEGKKN